MHRKKTLTITTMRRRSVRLPGGLMARCPVCERVRETISRAQAGEVLEVDESALERLIAEGRVHAIGTVSGSFRICKDSLFSR